MKSEDKSEEEEEEEERKERKKDGEEVTIANWATVIVKYEG